MKVLSPKKESAIIRGRELLNFLQKNQSHIMGADIENDGIIVQMHAPFKVVSYGSICFQASGASAHIDEKSQGLVQYEASRIRGAACEMLITGKNVTAFVGFNVEIGKLVGMKPIDWNGEGK